MIVSRVGLGVLEEYDGGPGGGKPVQHFGAVRDRRLTNAVPHFVSQAVNGTVI